MVHVDSPSSQSLVHAIAGALGVAFASCAPDFCQSSIPSPVIRASCSVDLAMEILTGRCACMRGALLEADFGRSRKPVNGLRFGVLAPLTTPTHHSASSSDFRLRASACQGFIEHFLNISSSMDWQASRINEKKVACQITVNVLPSSATRSRKPVS
jgi:hypothetical protein